MVEKYRSVVVTSTVRQSLSSPTVGEWGVLGGGVTKDSEVRDPVTGDPVLFKGLPNVGVELQNIVSEGRLDGARLLDEKFDAKSLGDMLSQRTDRSRRYNVVHLATHFRLGIDNSRSFLLLGGNRALTLAEVSDDSALDFTDVEPVTLSACDTAFGTATENRSGAGGANGAEVDSLATFI